MLTAANHFGHRDTDGIVVDLFWNRRNLKDEFRVQVEDRREGTRFVLHPLTGREKRSRPSTTRLRLRTRFRKRPRNA